MSSNSPSTAPRIPRSILPSKGKMAFLAKSLINKFTPSSSTTDLSTFTKARTPTTLFPVTDPEVDGEECLRDCDSCSVKYPRKFEVDEKEELFGHVNGWSRHVLCGTGRTDWVRDVSDEKGSLMEAFRTYNDKVENGKLMLSASNIPIDESPTVPNSSSVLLLPSFTIIENVTPTTIPDLITHILNPSVTNTTPLSPATQPHSNGTTTSSLPSQTHTNGDSHPPLPPPPTTSLPNSTSLPHGLTTRPCPHNYLILLCSQKTRDARCGQSAPLLLKEFERHLRPLGLQRDLHDTRPGGVGIYFISHVGGHKFAANVMIYRRATAPVLDGPACEIGVEGKDGKENGEGKGMGKGEAHRGLGAGQCIWLARVRPEDCENIVRYTVLQGKVLKPERQLRGGFDRSKGLASW
ncbi:hypothetical protein EJ08DRAFT_675962 [Tothia fuscella]|uniref:Sucrase n=1 Tax=Tothia fuscella TaxID=1048955 RepID=A0A9P4U2E7_9PEZI|nr:hypothetical protein EJ08DRAFT_675962 [Tothia fuscella]